MDPERLLHQLLTDMTDELVQAKSNLAECEAEERRLAKQIELAERAVSEWEQRARSAGRAGDDFVASDALVRQCHHLEQAQELRAAAGRQRLDVDNRKNALVGLNLRIEEAKIKRNGILLRAKRAHVESAITKVIVDLPRAEPLAKKPLAKTRTEETAGGKASPRDRAKVAGQKRTKR